jgi:hypothetical protein
MTTEHDIKHKAW